MNTEITIIASIFLLLGGLAAFPFTLDYSNTSWMPRWMRPDVDYLERPFRYDYPGRGMQIIFSLLVLFVGAMSLLTLLDKNLSQTVTPGQWFDSMSLVLPACQVSCILFMRQEYNDPFEYADRLTGFSMWKVTAALCLIPLLWLPYVAGLLDSSMYRFTVLSYNLLAYAFLVYDYIRVYRKRFDYEYRTCRSEGNVSGKPVPFGLSGLFGNPTLVSMAKQGSLYSRIWCGVDYFQSDEDSMPLSSGNPGR